MSSESEPPGSEAVPDERLRLIFTCCHPALNREAQIALSLRTLCGLTTEEIARAFLTPATTMGQRLVRAQRKIRAAGIPYEVPSGETLPERVESVTAVIYLVFNEGYSASVGDEIVRKDLCAEAIRLARILIGLMPDEQELRALLALMLIQDSRRDARMNAQGDLILLEDQDRVRWDRRQIDEGLALVARVIWRSAPGPYAIQAAIAAEHARANRFDDTDWSRIADLYSRLFEIRPTPVVELNRAVAIAMARGPQHGLEIVAQIEASGELDDYHLMWAVKADLLRRSGRFSEAANAYRRAIEVVSNNPHRRFLEGRLREMESMTRG